MKRIMKLFALCILLFSFIGCTYEEEKEDVTIKGKNVHDGWSEGMNEILNVYLDIPFRFNAWLEASPQDKDSIEFAYLYDYKIRRIDDYHWELYKSTDLAYSISLNGNLTEASANWYVMVYLNDHIEEQTSVDIFGETDKYTLSFYEYGDMLVNIRQATPNNWSILMRGTYQLDSVFQFNVKNLNTSLPASLIETEFLLNGKGYLTYSRGSGYSYKEASIDFMINESLRYVPAKTSLKNNRFLWSEGKAQMEAEQLTGYDRGLKTAIKTEFSQTSQGKHRVNITYRGISEMWSVN